MWFMFLCSCNKMHPCGAPPSSLMDSTTSPKVKTMEGKGVEVSFSACNTLRVEGCAGAPRWGLRRLTRNSITHTELHKPNNKLISAQLQHFGARTSHGQTWIHKIHHGSDLGETTTFSFIVYYVLGHRTNTQMSFVSGIPSGSLRIPNWES